jgi:hypothetical protein
MCAHHAQHPCTSTMYINTIQCAIRYHPWNVSTICQTCASTNMPTMCIYQYANHVHLPICQTMCIYQYASKCHNHVSQTNTNCCANQVIPMVYYHQAYAIYECTKHAYQHVSHLYQASISTMHQYHNMMNPHTCMPNPP